MGRILSVIIFPAEASVELQSVISNVNDVVEGVGVDMLSNAFDHKR